MTLKALSLFAGAGGDTLGMIGAGVVVVGFIEIDKDAITTHKNNFPDCKLLGEDITKVSEKTLDPYIGKIDIVFAGFPCQGFSKAGKKDPQDSRNSLFLEFVRVVKHIKPRVIIGENVPHIEASTVKGENAAEAVCSAFCAIGYTMAAPYKLLATDYGVPQQRRRCFFVGHLNSGKAFDFHLMPKKEKPSLRSILERHHLSNAVQVDKAIWNQIGVQRFIEVDGFVEPTGEPPRNLLKCLDEGKVSFGKRASSTHSEAVDPDGTSKTIICTYGRMPRLFVPVVRQKKDYFLRPFTVTELQQIQSFPHDFVLAGSYHSQVKQIGNAVPPNLGKALVEEVIAQLLSG